MPENADLTRRALFQNAYRETGSVEKALALTREAETYLDTAPVVVVPSPAPPDLPPILSPWSQPAEPPKPRAQRRRWTPEDRRLAAEHLDNGCGIDLTAAELGRTRSALMNQLYYGFVRPKVFTDFQTMKGPPPDDAE